MGHPEPSLASFHVEIGVDIVTGRGQEVDSVISINVPFIDGTTTLHEFGHLLGVQGHVRPIHPFAGVNPRWNSIMISGYHYRDAYPRVSNLSSWEINRFIELYPVVGD